MPTHFAVSKALMASFDSFISIVSIGKVREIQFDNFDLKSLNTRNESTALELEGLKFKVTKLEIETQIECNLRNNSNISKVSNQNNSKHEGA